MNTAKGSELEFICRINRDGTATEPVDSNYLKLLQNDTFTINGLSMTEKTFIASGMSCFVVKLKPKKVNKDAETIFESHFNRSMSGSIRQFKGRFRTLYYNCIIPAMEECAAQFKPKAVEVEKLKKKFFDEHIMLKNFIHVFKASPSLVWQWIQDNCLSQANETTEFSGHDIVAAIAFGFGVCKKENRAPFDLEIKEFMKSLSHSHGLLKKEVSDEEIVQRIKEMGWEYDGTAEVHDMKLIAQWMRDKLTK